MTEAELLTALQAKLGRLGLAQGNGVVKGIGDDCAIFRAKGSRLDLVFTTDMMHEGVHFTWDEAPAVVGHKALTRSLSDCAAMGARPLFCLLSLAFPATAAQWVDGFYSGFLKLAKKHGVILAGGDLSGTNQISCDVMVCGELPRGTAMLRSRAQAGDSICVSGPLGKAALALDTRRNFKPQPRLELGWRLREAGVRCCMDLSDGLSMDLARICGASEVSANVNSIAIAKQATLQHALHGGDDYELLFTLSKKIPLPAGCTMIGAIGKGQAGQVFYQGQPLSPQGWDHFRPQ